MTIYYNDYDITVKRIIDRLGKKIVIGVPLGLGKPIGLLNALYRHAAEDKSISLTILTALTLARPLAHSDLEKRFLNPIVDRILGDYEDPIYEHFRVKQQLPTNIKVIEFYLSPGKYLKNKLAQQDYISSNYTDVIRDTLNYSINVVAQQVAKSALYPEQYSLSCNTDLFSDLIQQLKKIEADENKIAIVAEINANLPFMPGDAIIKSGQFTDIVDTKQYRSLYAIPKAKLSLQDHLIGIYSSLLVKDNSCLQIGIGKPGDAVTSALILRHRENDKYQDILNKLQIVKKFNEVLTSVESLHPFEQGLYASTEMFSDAYMHLYKERILKKQVYDHAKLQWLLNERKISENITPEYIDILLENNLINPKLTQEDLLFLQKFGIIKADIVFKSGNLYLPSDEIIPADLTSSKSKELVINKCLGSILKSGKIIHAGFFLGSTEFYCQLKNLSAEELMKFEMTRISRTNTLCWSHELSELQRQQARFINAAMMVTLDGAIISDGLKNWQEISGVGGQSDFANMAQKLANSRFIINCRSTRYDDNGKIHSNILWNYSNVTLPRNMRDIIITEYGIADCHSKTDAETIKAILNVTDSRYQQQLLKTAKHFGKINRDYKIPAMFQENYPEKLQTLMSEFQREGFFKTYPFGSELTEEEIIIKNALMYLKNCSKLQLIYLILRAILFTDADIKYRIYLHRMKLDNPKNIKDIIYKKILKYAINNYS